MMTKAATQNYTPEQTQEIVARYQAGETVEALAEAVGKSVRSVVAKLSREGVYQAKTATKGAARVKKADLVDELAKHCGVPAEVFESLEKANHDALELLVAQLRG
jgi:transposase-like protein